MDHDEFVPGHEQTEELSARERLRTGRVETPPPDVRKYRRAAAILIILALTGVPILGYLFAESGGATGVVVGIVLLAYTAALVYAMVRTIRRR